MRPLLSFCSVAFLALVTLVVACNTVDPSDCYPNTSGGFGGSGTIPIGAGVGVGSGDYHTPRWQPLSFPGGANPCVSMGGDTSQPGGGTSAAAGGGVMCEVDTGAGGASGAAGDVVMCGNFGASLFKFKTIIPDDGTGDAGGWQQAPVSLNYVRTIAPEGAWTCSFTVGIPLRTKADGVIPPSYAAGITSEVVSDAWSNTRQSLPDAPGGIFCSAFKQAATALFASLFPKTGIRVMP